MFEKKFGLGLMGAAALAACSPEKAPDDTGLNKAQTEAVMKETGNTIEITIPEEVVSEPELNAQYTQEQIDEILSGTTGEPDSMTSEEIDKLGTLQE